MVGDVLRSRRYYAFERQHCYVVCGAAVLPYRAKRHGINCSTIIHIGVFRIYLKELNSSTYLCLLVKKINKKQ